MTLGVVTLPMRAWCRRLYKGTRWWRTREYAFKTHCDRYRTPHYAIVERMRDIGLIVFVPGDATKGYVWEARLTELGEDIGRREPSLKLSRFLQHGEEHD